jgi:hypothetical protein
LPTSKACSSAATIQHYLPTARPTSIFSIHFFPLQSIHGAEFQHHLELLRQFRGVVPYNHFLQEFRRSVPAASEDDVLQVTDALATSGSILRHGNLVYLRPTEIISTLRRVLPQDVDAVRQRIAETEQDLALLETERTEIVRRAGMKSKMVNYAFFSILVAQWALLFRLTYWELSWDVIVGLFIYLYVCDYKTFYAEQRVSEVFEIN